MSEKVVICASCRFWKRNAWGGRGPIPGLGLCSCQNYAPQMRPDGEVATPDDKPACRWHERRQINAAIDGLEKEKV